MFIVDTLTTLNFLDPTTDVLDGTYTCTDEDDRLALTVAFNEVLEITSPNYPSNYDDFDCHEWVIYSSQGTVITMTITDFRVNIYLYLYPLLF